MTKHNRNFKIALASRGLSLKDFAATVPCSAPAIIQIINGKSKSRRISKAIKKIISEEFDRLCISGDKVGVDIHN